MAFLNKIFGITKSKVEDESEIIKIKSKFNKKIIIDTDDIDESDEIDEIDETDEIDEIDETDESDEIKENNGSEQIDKIDEMDETNIEDNFANYIIGTSMKKYTSNSEFIRFGWNGIDLLDRWELQRKVNMDHATKLAYSMRTDYKIHKEFISYDPIHIGKIENESPYYVLDGQHRLEAYNYFYQKNEYPIQQIPAIIWYVKNQSEFVNIFHKINDRISIDKLKLVQIKLLEIIAALEDKYGKSIWGLNRPKINKDIFIDKLKDTDFIHKLTTDEILNALFKINDKIRGLPRNSRVIPKCGNEIHHKAENLDFFLGLDKQMSWISNI